MPQQKSNFYFIGTLPQKDHDIPFFGFRTGSNLAVRWASADVSDLSGFKQLTEVINPQVPVHFAMPRITAQSLFPLGRAYKRLILEAYGVPRNATPSNENYRIGRGVKIAFNDVYVQSHSPIMGGDYPFGGYAQRVHFEKLIGREFHAGFSIKVLATYAEVD